MTVDWSLFATQWFPLHATALRKLATCPLDAAAQFAGADIQVPESVPSPKLAEKAAAAQIRIAGIRDG